MSADVEVLLALTRGEGQQEAVTRLLPGDQIRAVVAELEESQPQQVGRLVIQGEGLQQPVDANPALVRMLFRNLLQNALKHTHGDVYITLSAAAVDIRDTGPGLSREVIQQLAVSPVQHTTWVPGMTRGLGLFIVQLVCERLGWPLSVNNSATTGTTIRIQTSTPDI
ncbi:MAG: hypothetical protein EA349_08165 [Halomonadaceae bacterium]|nr:MAG: hypothetical protein EA349_08165 [Halomonadaceae bacterium]